MAGVWSLFIFHLVTRVCLAGGVLTTKVPWDYERATSLQLPKHGYLPAMGNAAPKRSPATNDDSKDAPSAAKRIGERSSHTGYSYAKPRTIEFKLPLRDQTTKSPSNHRSTYQEVRVTHGTGGPARTSKTLTASPVTELEYHPHVPRRTSYRVVEEENDEYTTDDSNDGGSGHRGKARTTYPHRDSQDITTAIKALDHFLSGALNGDGYNSELHPPPNPVLALVLSRYGRYVPGARNPRVYAHMAVNNLHNNQPFGKYKEEREEDHGYVLR